MSGNLSADGPPVQSDVSDEYGVGGGLIGENGSAFHTVLNGRDLYVETDAATWSPEGTHTRHRSGALAPEETLTR